MTRADLLRRRLSNQHVSGPPLKTPEDVVAWLGAVQAQEYPSAKWAIATRTRGVTDASLDDSFDAGRFLRTHVMRPTWHFVPAADIRWMLELTAPRVISACRSYCLRMKLDDAVYARSHAVLAKVLRGGKHLTRRELGSALREAGITSPRDEKQRLAFIVMRAELDAVVCSGPKVGAQLTYALLDERVPHGKRVDRAEALAELTRRYFVSHGPATLMDFRWWSGLSALDARAGLEAVRSELVSADVDGKVYWHAKRQVSIARDSRRAYLLTTYDECFVAYRDRAPVEPALAKQLSRDRGQTVVIDGRIVGTWQRSISKGGVVLHAIALSSFKRSQRDAVAAVAERYGGFLGTPVTVAFER